MSHINKTVGTLLPMTSLVSNTTQSGTFSAGELFIDWLIDTKQSAWQILPLHATQLQINSKTKHVPSPYKGYGIGLDPRFLETDATLPSDSEISEFIKVNKYWINSYVLFSALRDYFGTDNWSKWPSQIRDRNKTTLKIWQKKLAPQIAGHLIVQAQLHIAYQKLQTKARKNNILLIGDMPFYLCLNSPLVWEFQDFFDLDNSGELCRVSGVLKGAKSHFGRQIWGHPLYDWQNSSKIRQLQKLFKIRIKYLASLFNMVRFDHAKGLFSYGVIDMKDHKLDAYYAGPGRPFLESLIKFARTKKLKIYAEDTGDKLKDLRNCLHVHHLPGVKIFRFAYNEKTHAFADQYLHISSYQKNTVAYTTTHDTEPLLSYLEKLNTVELGMLIQKLRIKHYVSLSNLVKIIRDKIIDSPAKIVLIPLQDWLVTNDRINTPGTEKAVNDQNWLYKMNVQVENLPVRF